MRVFGRPEPSPGTLTDSRTSPPLGQRTDRAVIEPRVRPVAVARSLRALGPRSAIVRITSARLWVRTSPLTRLPADSAREGGFGAHHVRISHGSRREPSGGSRRASNP